MSDTSGINSTITSKISTNGQQLITGAILAAVLGSGGLTAWVATQYTPHVASLAALRSFTSVYATRVIRDDYAPGNGAPAMLYTWNASCPAPTDNAALYVAPLVGAGCWSAQADPNVVNPKEWGAKCDGATQDQIPMQFALSAAEALKKSFPVPGSCVVSGLSVNVPVKFQGNGDQSQIILASGSSAPAISISIPSTAPGIVGNWANVTLEDLIITSPNRADANRALEHGIVVADAGSPAVTVVNLINASISGIPGDGIHAIAHSGYFNLVNSNVILPGQSGFYCNSSTDTVVNGGAFYGALNYNIVLSNCFNTKVNNINSFDSVQSGVYVYQSGDVVFDNDTLDTSGQHSIDIQNTSGQVVTFLGGLIRWSSTSANATYYDLFSDNGNAGTTTLFGTHFPTPASSTSSNKPAGNVGFYGAGSAPIDCFNCVFDLGQIGTAGITNSATNQLYSGSSQNYILRSAAQYTGQAGYNGTNLVWNLFCNAVGCDNGVLQLLSGNSVGAQISAYGASFLQTLSLVGIPTSAGSGGLYVCVDSTGATYKKSSCP